MRASSFLGDGSRIVSLMGVSLPGDRYAPVESSLNLRYGRFSRQVRWRKEHHWSPHQLRHTRATEIRHQADLDTARAVLGHQSAAVTEIYAEQDLSKAAKLMKRIG